MRLAILVGAGLTLVVALTPALLPIVGIDAGVAREASVFVWARAFGVIPFLIQVALRSYLSAHGRTSPLVIAVVARLRAEGHTIA